MGTGTITARRTLMSIKMEYSTHTAESISTSLRLHALAPGFVHRCGFGADFKLPMARGGARPQNGENVLLVSLSIYKNKGVYPPPTEKKKKHPNVHVSPCLGTLPPFRGDASDTFLAFCASASGPGVAHEVAAVAQGDGMFGCPFWLVWLKN